MVGRGPSIKTRPCDTPSPLVRPAGSPEGSYRESYGTRRCLRRIRDDHVTCNAIYGLITSVCEIRHFCSNARDVTYILTRYHLPIGGLSNFL